jgi:hypothetical protein
MFGTPGAGRIKAHTPRPALADTPAVLIGGTHVFGSNGVPYHIDHSSLRRMPGEAVHEAPAGSRTLNILEGGWAVGCTAVQGRYRSMSADNGWAIRVTGADRSERANGY